MTSRWTSLGIDCHDTRAQAAFWCAVLGWEVLEDEDDGAYLSIGPAGGGDPGPPTVIDLLRVPEAKTIKNRLHLDLRADGSSTADELARLLALGAVRVDVGQGPDVSWVVLADPEGNEFCLLSRTVQVVEAESS